jgi:hypothetical protein
VQVRERERERDRFFCSWLDPSTNSRLFLLLLDYPLPTPKKS